MRRLFLFLILIYKRFVSPILRPLFGEGCRFTPTCSEYAYQSIGQFGILKGLRISFIRFLKCHPFSHEPFYDPVPERRVS